MKLRSPVQIVEENKALTMGQLRWLLHCRNTNGLRNATVKIGRRVYIDADAFSGWLESKKEN